MEIINGGDFPPLAYDDVKRIALNHQAILRDIRLAVSDFNPDNFDINDAKRIIEYIKKRTK